MSDSLTTFLIIMSEAAGFFAIVITILLVFRIRSGITLKRSAKKFVKRIKNENSDHSEKLKTILINDYSLDDSTASSAVDNLIEQEHLLYSKIIDLYLGNKNQTLDDIDDDVKNLTEVMHGVTVSSSTIFEDAGGQSDQTDGADEKVKKLQEDLKIIKLEKDKIQAEKEQVQEELKDAMDTMEGMMTEYASMYSGGGVNQSELKPDDDIAKVKDKINEIKQKSEDREKAESDNTDADIDLNVDVPDLDIGEEN